MTTVTNSDNNNNSNNNNKSTTNNNDTVADEQGSDGCCTRRRDRYKPNSDESNSHQRQSAPFCTRESMRLTRKKIKRPIPCIVAWILLVGSTIGYFLFVSPCFYQHTLKENFEYWLAITCAQLVVLFYTMLNFLIAIFRDPGRFQKVIISPDDPQNDDNKCPLYRSITIKKATVKTKWCSTCNFYRPPRCSHCSICNACIDQFDHHCPWLNNCVGKRNYRFFFQFLASLCLHMIGVFCVCLPVALEYRPFSSFEFIVACVLMSLIGLLIFPIGGLFIFHIVLISNGSTTNEHVTGKYRGNKFFSRGPFLNFIYLFCGSLTPKLKPYKSMTTSTTIMMMPTRSDEHSMGADIELKQLENVAQKSLVTNNRAGAFRSTDAGTLEGETLHDASSSGVNQIENGGERLQEQDLLELVLKNKRERAAQEKSLDGNVNDRSNDSMKSSSMLNQSKMSPVSPVGEQQQQQQQVHSPATLSSLR